MAQFLPLPGGTVLLPDYARADLAFSLSQTAASPGQNGGQIWKVPPGYLDVLFSVNTSMGTGATPGTRVIYMEIRAPDNTVLAQLPGGEGQPASTNADWFFSSSLATAISATGAGNGWIFAAPLPLFLLYPSAYVNLWNLGAVSGDSGPLNPSLTVLRVPQGPETTSATVAPVATPVLV